MKTISWEPLMAQFGARVDVDLREELSPGTVHELQQIFDEKHILVFNSPNLSYDDQRRVISMFGDVVDEGGLKYLSNTVGYQGEGEPDPVMLDPKSSTTFHNDYAFMPEFLHGISLYAEEVSPGVEGTRFLSLRNGYLELSDEERSALEGRTAIQAHDLTVQHGNPLRLKDFTTSETIMAAEHPLLFPHPRTGEKVLLYIPYFTTRIVGMTDAESAAWFERFEDVLYQEDKIYTHRWQQDDLVIWSNVAMQHGREFPDVLPDPQLKRTMRRVAFGSMSASTAAAEFLTSHAVTSGIEPISGGTLSHTG